MELVNALAVAVGGALGCVSRWLVSQMPFLVVRAAYWPTLSVNVAGCLAIGIAAALGDHYQPSGVWYRLAVTGFLGGFTTYSAFSLDAIRLWQSGCLVQLSIYVGLTVILGFAACFAGFTVTDRLVHTF
ncbi:MAG: CrcB family protein [Muribaculaceae bacterium]|nr:CrcB family protein [Muribaculaceae bacterium]